MVRGESVEHGMNQVCCVSSNHCQFRHELTTMVLRLRMFILESDLRGCRSFWFSLDDYRRAFPSIDAPKQGDQTLLTESTVETMFRRLINDPNRNEETFDKAEELLEEELRPESPLRHRLSVELDELRSLSAKD